MLRDKPHIKRCRCLGNGRSKELGAVPLAGATRNLHDQAFHLPFACLSGISVNRGI